MENWSSGVLVFRILRSRTTPILHHSGSPSLRGFPTPDPSGTELRTNSLGAAPGDLNHSLQTGRLWDNGANLMYACPFYNALRHHPA